MQLIVRHHIYNFFSFFKQIFFGRFGLFYRLNNGNYFNSRVDSFSRFLLSETYSELSLSLKQFSFYRVSLDTELSLRAFFII